MNMKYINGVMHVLTLGLFVEPPPPTAKEVARNQLRDAELKLLDHQRDAEYHQHMVSMLEQRVARLRGLLQEPSEIGVHTIGLLNKISPDSVRQANAKMMADGVIQAIKDQP